MLHCPALWGQSARYKVCVPTLTHKTDSSALFVPTYTKLASVFDHVVELKHCQHVVLCGISVVFCNFILHFEEAGQSNYSFKES